MWHGTCSGLVGSFRFGVVLSGQLEVGSGSLCRTSSVRVVREMVSEYGEYGKKPGIAARSLRNSKPA
jgi:hypothetical protein